MLVYLACVRTAWWEVEVGVWFLFQPIEYEVLSNTKCVHTTICINVKTHTWIKWYTSPSGAVTSRNLGVLQLITTNVESTFSITWIQLCKFLGKTVSSISMSLEKRFMIRPDGVVSKNSMGHIRQLCKMSKCKFLDALMVPLTMINVPRYTATARKRKTEQH